MVGYTSQNYTVEFSRFIIQFQSDSLDTWPTCNVGVVDVKDTPFTWISLLFAEFVSLDYVKIGQQ